MREAEIADIGHQPVGQDLPALRGVIGGALPGHRVEFVDGHRRGVGIGAGALVHPRLIVPLERRGAVAAAGHHGRRGGRRLGGQRHRVGLVRQGMAVRADDVVLVAAAAVGAERLRDEQLPDAGAVAQAHGVAHRVPAIEIGDDRHALGVGRPHREAHAGFAIDGQALRAEAVAEFEVAAFVEQVQVQIAQQEAEGVGVGAALLVAVRPADQQAVVARLWRLRVGQAAGEHAAGVQGGHRGHR
ncbi:hypothetical protein D3C87_1042070 [compost metagenome]